MTKVDAPTVFVLTLYSGEGEFETSCEVLRRQSGVFVEQRVFSNMANKEAHVALYETIAAQSRNYDYFLKLDADMVLRSDHSLQKMVGEFAAQADTDVMTWPVMDHFSGSNIYGIHMFSDRVRWNTNIPDVFVDPPPVFPGQKIIHPLDSWADVVHAPLPSMRQAFEFGVHRGFKTFKAREKDPRNIVFHLGILRRVWRAFQASGDQTRGLALLGAEFVRTGYIQTANYRNNSEIDKYYEAACQLSRGDIVRTCQRYWSFEAPVVLTFNRAKSRLSVR